MIYEGTQLLNRIQKGIQTSQQNYPIILFQNFFGYFSDLFRIFLDVFGCFLDIFGCFQDNFWFRLFWIFFGCFWIFFGSFLDICRMFLDLFWIFFGCLEHPYHPKFKLTQATYLKMNNVHSVAHVKGKSNSGFLINLLNYEFQVLHIRKNT